MRAAMNATSLGMAVIVGVLLINVGCDDIGKVAMSGKPMPHYVHVADFTNDIAGASIVWPEAIPWSYNLLLAIPLEDASHWPLSRSCPSFRGIVHVRDDKDRDVGSYGISEETSQHCNWLTEHALDAYILCWQQTNCLKTTMTPGRVYTISVEIPSRPKEITSVWLGYVQGGNVRK